MQGDYIILCKVLVKVSRKIKRKIQGHEPTLIPSWLEN